MYDAETGSLGVMMAIATEAEAGTASATVTRLQATEIDCRAIGSLGKECTD